jgi:transcriptional regulator with XRE-family HTH domain
MAPFWGSPLKHLRSTRQRALIEALVKARKAAGLTQRQLAARLKRSNSFVWKIEAGERRIEVLEFAEISRALGVKPSAICAKVLD